MNTFTDIWRNLNRQQKEELARQLDTSVAYLYQLSTGHRKAGKHLKKAMAELLQVPVEVIRAA